MRILTVARVAVLVLFALGVAALAAHARKIPYNPSMANRGSPYVELAVVAGHVSVDCERGLNFYVSMAADTYVDNPTNCKDGDVRHFKMDGAHAVHFGNQWRGAAANGTLAGPVVFQGTWDNDNSLMNIDYVNASQVPLPTPTP